MRQNPRQKLNLEVLLRNPKNPFLKLTPDFEERTFNSDHNGVIRVVTYQGIRYLIFGIIYLVIYLFMIIRRINTEELILEKEFEEEYAEYKESSKKLIPFIY